MFLHSKVGTLSMLCVQALKLDVLATIYCGFGRISLILLNMNHIPSTVCSKPVTEFRCLTFLSTLNATVENISYPTPDVVTFPSTLLPKYQIPSVICVQDSTASRTICSIIKWFNHIVILIHPIHEHRDGIEKSATCT